MAKILVIDDDPDVVEALDLFLKKGGYEIASAGNREEGMKAIASFKPDLIILDVMMELPDDGLAMAQQLRREGDRTPILMLTSVGQVTGMEYDKDEEMVPVDEFYEKPINPDILAAIVKRLLKKKGS